MSLGELRPNAHTNMVYLWHLEGNANDSSGNGLTGVSGSITYSSANGKFGQGAGFVAASNSYLASPQNLTNPVTFSHSLWFKTSVDGSNIVGFCDRQTGNPASYVDRTVDIYNHKIDLWNGSSHTSGSMTVDDGKWHYLVYTSNSLTQKIYVDGNLQISASGGSSYSGWWRYDRFYGTTNMEIDEIAYFTDTKSASWVRQQYAIGKWGEM